MLCMETELLCGSADLQDIKTPFTTAVAWTRPTLTKRDPGTEAKPSLPGTRKTRHSPATTLARNRPRKNLTKAPAYKTTSTQPPKTRQLTPPSRVPVTVQPSNQLQRLLSFLGSVRTRASKPASPGKLLLRKDTSVSALETAPKTFLAAAAVSMPNGACARPAGAVAVGTAAFEAAGSPPWFGGICCAEALPVHPAWGEQGAIGTGASRMTDLPSNQYPCRALCS